MRARRRRRSGGQSRTGSRDVGSNDSNTGQSPAQRERGAAASVKAVNAGRAHDHSWNSTWSNFRTHFGRSFLTIAVLRQCQPHLRNKGVAVEGAAQAKAHVRSCL